MLESENQSRRWVKYGVNVGLSSVVVVLLAAGVVYISQRHPKRIDTTVAGIYSLKPQTKAVLGATTQKVRLVSLYPNPTLEGKSGDARATAEDERSRAGVVEDLLQEYSKASKNVSIDFIDPERESTKLDLLIEEVTNKYGEELKPYKAFLAEFPGFVDRFKAFADAQGKAVEPLGFDQVKDPELAQTLAVVRGTITGLTPRLAEAQENIGRYTKRKIPDYRAAADQIVIELQILDSLVGKVIEQFGALPNGTPDVIKAYVTSALPAYKAMQAEVTGQLDKAKKLGEIKLDALRRSIGRSSLLVMGENEMKVLGFGDVWQAPDDLRSLMNSTTSEKPKLKFAGEQQVSTALVSISRKKKPLAIFVRPGGMPLAQNVFGRAMWSGVARRLKDADFEIVEKDLSGQFAQQAAMQGMPVSEASEEQMRDRGAVWIVFNVTSAMSQAGPNPIPGKLREHLTEGGSAVVMSEPDSDPMEGALSGWGVKLRTDAIVVKDVPKDIAAADSSDIIARAQFIPYLFVTGKYGEHALTKPVGALQSLLVALTPVEVVKGDKDAKVTPLLPVTREVKTWGETSTEAVFRQDGPRPVFDPVKDVENSPASPLYGGAAVEKGGGRLVVLGTASSFSNNILSIADPELERRGIMTARFPGNAELFTDAVLWCGKNDTMLEISPAAMEVSRIEPMSDGQLAAIRYGVLLGGLPGVVVVAGVCVYLARRS